MNEDTIDYLLEKIGSLETRLDYCETALDGEHINVGFKRLSETAKVPTKAHEKDAGWDLYSDEEVKLPFAVPVLVKTGIAFEHPPYYHGLIWDRSSMGKRGVHILGGLIDNSYTGEVGAILINLNREVLIPIIEKGQKITQIVFTKLPISSLIEKENLSETERGERGFGSSGSF